MGLANFHMVELPTHLKVFFLDRALSGLSEIQAKQRFEVLTMLKRHLTIRCLSSA